MHNHTHGHSENESQCSHCQMVCNISIPVFQWDSCSSKMSVQDSYSLLLISDTLNLEYSENLSSSVLLHVISWGCGSLSFKMISRVLCTVNLSSVQWFKNRELIKPCRCRSRCRPGWSGWAGRWRWGRCWECSWAVWSNLESARFWLKNKHQQNWSNHRIRAAFQKLNTDGRVDCTWISFPEILFISLHVSPPQQVFFPQIWMIHTGHLVEKS